MPVYFNGYETPFTCIVCHPHPHHGDTACQAKTEDGRCGCDG